MLCESMYIEWCILKCTLLQLIVFWDKNMHYPFLYYSRICNDLNYPSIFIPNFHLVRWHVMLGSSNFIPQRMFHIGVFGWLGMNKYLLHFLVRVTSHALPYVELQCFISLIMFAWLLTILLRVRLECLEVYAQIIISVYSSKVMV